MITLEICVDDVAGIHAAVQGGANRIELCAALGLGGLTPSAGLMRIARDAGLPAMVMIRPRAGDFVWTHPERAALIADIDAARRAGLAGVVIGASLPDGRLDGETLEQLVIAAEGMELTLHRAIDLTPDIAAAMRLCQDLGIHRVLSSGGAQTVMAGIDRLAQMFEHDVTVMPGGGVTPENITALAMRLPLTDVHASCSMRQAPPHNPRVSEFGFQPPNARATDVNRVVALRRMLDHLATD